MTQDEELRFDLTEDTETEAPSDSMEIRLHPSDIAINPLFSQLRTDRSSADYKAGIKRLAKQLQEEGGQKQPVTIRYNTLPASTDEGRKSYELVAGHRRYDAAVMAGTDLLCKFEDLNDQDAIRWARRENFSREDFSPMEKAKIIKSMREDGMATGKIADELGVSSATVTQTEKLLDMPAAVQKDVESGKLTPSGALELGPVEEKKRDEVMKVAEKEAAKDAEKEAAEKEKKAAKTGLARDKKKAEEASKKAEAAKKGEVKVEGKHVRQAAKKVKGAVKGRVKAAQRADIVAMFERVAKMKGNLKDFATLALRWISGKGGVKEADVVGALVLVAEGREIPATVMQANEPAKKAKKDKDAPKPSVKPVAATHRAKGKEKVKSTPCKKLPVESLRASSRKAVAKKKK